MMNNYEWNQPDNLKRFSMFLSPKVGNGTKLPFQFSSVGQNPPGDFSKQSDGSLFTKTAKQEEFHLLKQDKTTLM
ncbi:hypothetical protein ASZ78_004422 [Callipepla squamata]|uniref:Uncharacterized protein n=1 Tax=Callipepla squamata TaxID=9009 RepID=A0A226NDY2_CALSU|nr:hypothetical protein ASZ78_004422 [Callipepla squamata]